MVGGDLIEILKKINTAVSSTNLEEGEKLELDEKFLIFGQDEYNKLSSVDKPNINCRNKKKKMIIKKFGIKNIFPK